MCVRGNDDLGNVRFIKGLVFVQHKKLSVEGGGGGPVKDFRKGEKQGDLQIWDPVDRVMGNRVQLLLAAFLQINVTAFLFPFQQWNKHYCVISDDKLYYAEEEEQEEEDTQKVKVVSAFNFRLFKFPKGLNLETKPVVHQQK